MLKIILLLFKVLPNLGKCLCNKHKFGGYLVLSVRQQAYLEIKSKIMKLHNLLLRCYYNNAWKDHNKTQINLIQVEIDALKRLIIKHASHIPRHLMDQLNFFLESFSLVLDSKNSDCLFFAFIMLNLIYIPMSLMDEEIYL